VERGVAAPATWCPWSTGVYAAANGCAATA
jgi:hypothetical protein